jgi:hypothetical protein
MPYDSEEDHLFLNSGKTSEHSNLPTISQIFDRIRVLITNSGSSGFAGDLTSTTLNPNSQIQLINSLKADSQKPYSIILKYVISSGIEGFRSGTNGSHSYFIFWEVDIFRKIH